MRRQFYFTTLLVLSFLTGALSTDCSYEETDYLGDVVQVIKATCYEGTSGLSPNLNHENATKTEILLVTANSTIQHLQSTSSLSTLTELRVLRLRFTQINEISPGVFDSLNKLENIDLSNNLLEDIPAGVFNKLVKLEDLDLSQNKLTKISAGTFDNLKSLIRLYLFENLITHIDDGSFADLVAVRVLKLHKNKITLLQNNLFKNMKQLSFLDISDNPLDELQDVGFEGPEVTILAIRNNLRKFDVNISQSTISHFELIEGQLEEFDFCNMHPSSEVISLSKNRLKTAENLHRVNVNSIYLVYNNLTKIGKFSPETVGLFLQHNQITHVEKIEDPSNYKLMFLDISFNQLQSATCFGLPQLIDLSLEHNHITAINQNDFLGCPTVYNLNLASNSIETIEENSFKSLYILQNLILSHNRLNNLNPESFTGLTKLVVFYFDHNNISSFDVEGLSKSLPKLDRVKVGGNLIKCEDLDLIKPTLEQHNIRIFDEEPKNESICIQKN